jgi:hypothetical protein
MAATNAIQSDITVRAPKQQRRILRSVGAVLAGLVFVIVITTTTDALMHATGIFPPEGQVMAGSLFLLALAYRTIYGLAGGYVAARFAPQSPIRHAVVLGCIGLLLGTAGTLATWNRGPEFGPKWYAIAVIVSAIPSAWIGGKLVRRD